MPHHSLDRRRGTAAPAFALATLLLAACGTPAAERAPGSGAEDLLVAAPWPWAARADIRYGEGMELAVEEINARGGVRGRQVRILRIDDQESIDEGRIVAQQLTTRPEVAAVIGHLQSYVTVPAAAVYDLGGAVLLAPSSTDPSLTTRGYRRVFRSTYTDNQVGDRIAEHAAERGYRRVAIYYARSPYGRSLANAFEERATQLGSRVVARASYEEAAEADARGFERTLREWKQMDMDAVFVAGTLPAAGTLIAAMRRSGLEVPIMAGDAMSLPGLIAIGGRATEGTVVASSFHVDEPRPEVQRFAAAFRARYDGEPDAAAALAYDAMHLLAHALERAPASDPASVAAALRQTDGWRGVTNDFAFDENGELRAPRLKLMVVRDGAFRYLPDAAP